MANYYVATKAISKPLYQYRVKNSQDYRYVQADNLHDASRKLAAMNIEPDVLTYAGEVVVEKI